MEKLVRKIILYVAIRLDGYIVRGDVALHGQGVNSDNQNSNQEFFKDIDTVIMGWNTYHQIVTELSPEMWVYDNLITYVFTHKYYENGAKIKFTNDDAYDFLNLLKS